MCISCQKTISRFKQERLIYFSTYPTDTNKNLTVTHQVHFDRACVRGCYLNTSCRKFLGSTPSWNATEEIVASVQEMISTSSNNEKPSSGDKIFPDTLGLSQKTKPVKTNDSSLPTKNKNINDSKLLNNSDSESSSAVSFNLLYTFLIINICHKIFTHCVFITFFLKRGSN